MMEGTLLLALPKGMLIDQIQCTDTGLAITVIATHLESCCPLCSQASSSVHSHYQRTLSDVPCAGQLVQLSLTVRRFYCYNSLCERKVFTERIPQFVKPWARMTIRLCQALQSIGLATNGQGGTRLAARLGMQTSRNTILHRIMEVSDASLPSVVYLGVDDFSFRRGYRFGTILVNLPFRAERRHQIWSVDIRYLDMHSLQGIEMVYCISILENFSRAILASAISVRQDTEAFFAVFYAAVRRYGVPEMLVSDNGSIFLSHDTRRVCAQLGIEKREIKKGRPYQNYIEAAFGVQRRMADWSFERAQTWEDLLAAHDKWMIDYNYQRHMAHEERQDGCHSPAEVLGWVKGVHQAFSAICETRRLDKAGYAKFRNWSLYGERGLAGEIALVNIFQDFLTVEYEQEKLSRYSVEWQPDDRHLARVGNPRFYRHPYQSARASNSGRKARSSGS